MQDRQREDEAKLALKRTLEDLHATMGPHHQQWKAQQVIRLMGSAITEEQKRDMDTYDQLHAFVESLQQLSADDLWTRIKAMTADEHQLLHKAQTYAVAALDDTREAIDLPADLLMNAESAFDIDKIPIKQLSWRQAVLASYVDREVNLFFSNKLVPNAAERLQETAQQLAARSISFQIAMIEETVTAVVQIRGRHRAKQKGVVSLMLELVQWAMRRFYHPEVEAERQIALPSSITSPEDIEIIKSMGYVITFRDHCSYIHF